MSYPMKQFETIPNNVPFGQKDYRVYVGSEAEGWELINMQERRVKKLAISLKGFFESTYHNPLNSHLYAQTFKDKGTYYPVFVTLTYKSQDDWDAKDISKIVDNYRKDWKQRLGRPPKHFRYVWVAEMQKRGCIHYHLLLWCPRGKRLPKPDVKWWKKGYSNIQAVRKGVQGYLSKYLSKGSQPANFEGKKVYFPKGARIVGMGGLSSADRKKIAYKKLPRYVRRIFDYGEKIEKIKGGYKQGTTEIVSPYTFERVSFDPVLDKYSQTGYTGGRLTCIFVKFRETFVMLEDKKEYLEKQRGNKNVTS
jgi:hypothetical protein